MLLSSKLDSHLAECGFRIVRCTYCDKDMVANDLEVSCGGWEGEREGSKKKRGKETYLVHGHLL